MEGNKMKMREALVEISKIADDWSLYANSKAGALDRIYELANAALSETPRNCDIPYKCRVEMYGAFKDWCKANGWTMEPMLAWNAFDWLLASSKKKGDSSNEEQAQAGSI